MSATCPTGLSGRFLFHEFIECARMSYARPVWKPTCSNPRSKPPHPLYRLSSIKLSLLSRLRTSRVAFARSLNPFEPNALAKMPHFINCFFVTPPVGLMGKRAINVLRHQCSHQFARLLSCQHLGQSVPKNQKRWLSAYLMTFTPTFAFSVPRVSQDKTVREMRNFHKLCHFDAPTALPSGGSIWRDCVSRTYANYVAMRIHRIEHCSASGEVQLQQIVPGILLGAQSHLPNLNL